VHHRLLAVRLPLDKAMPSKTDATKERDALHLQLKKVRSEAVKHGSKATIKVLDQMTEWVEKRESDDPHTISMLQSVTDWIEEHVIAPLSSKQEK